MRFNPEPVDPIHRSARESFDPQARVWPSGSRVANSKLLGGDGHLLGHPRAVDTALRCKISMLDPLESRLDEGREFTES